MNPLKYLSEVRSELSKVVWPKWDEVVRLTIVVLIVSGAVAIYVGAIDFGLTKLLGLIIVR